MSDKKAHRSQKKPARKGSGRPIKPDYREMPFNMKVMLAKAGNDLLHPATMPAALRISGYDGPIPGSILEAPEYGDLNRIRATTILETYTEHAVWIESLRDGVPIDDSSDFFALRWFAESINSRGRFPTIGEIADDRRQTDDERRRADGNRNRKNADYERALKKAFDERYLLPRVADADLKDIMSVFEADPGVINNEPAFRKLVTETKPIYTPVGHWPLDLICHLLVGADIGGLDDESTPVLVPFGLPEYLDVLEWEGFKRAAQKVERRGRDWTQLPATKKAAFRKRLMKTGKQLVAQAVPWAQASLSEWNVWAFARSGR
ncbi:MAG: hypothetical protein KDN05_02405 [Verrucomicrobiae bacterium]|nr:hypothetical protein [Verrucomicrobiae bacterium]